MINCYSLICFLCQKTIEFVSVRYKMGNYQSNEELDKFVLAKCDDWVKQVETTFASAARHDPEWKKPPLFSRKHVTIGDIDMKFSVLQRTTNSQPEEEFYYWNRNAVNLPLKYVVEFLTRKIDLTHLWTPICTETRLLYEKKI